MPDGNHDFSTCWRLVKSYFTRNCNAKYRQTPSGSRRKKKKQSIWQRRFWEHTIRTEEDFVRHVEYIHYNPVKHGLAPAPKDWEYSSFHRYVRNGIYHLEWASGQDIAFSIAVGNE